MNHQSKKFANGEKNLALRERRGIQLPAFG
jgi:hypothetical protein